MWRLVRAEFAYRVWEVGPAFGLVAFVLMAVGVRSHFSVRFPPNATTYLILGLVMIPMLVQMIFLNGEKVEKRLVMAGALPVNWKDLSAYRLLCSALLQLILFAIAAVISRVIRVNGELVSVWSLVTLNGVGLFFVFIGLCFNEAKLWSPWRSFWGLVALSIVNTAALFGFFFPGGFSKGFAWPLVGTFWGTLGAYLLAAATAAAGHIMFLKRSTLAVKG